MFTPTPVPAVDLAGLADGLAQATTQSPVLVPLLVAAVLAGLAFMLVRRARKAVTR